MQQARYFCSGALSPSDYHHYGLAAPIYTHFTSPIRRYSDQMVHRLLAAKRGQSGVTQPPLAVPQLAPPCLLSARLAAPGGSARPG